MAKCLLLTLPSNRERTVKETLQAELWKQCGHLLEVAEKTVDCLGEERAWLFVDLANDWLDIHLHGILEAYMQEELLTSLVYHDFTGLFKELRWFQILFLAGNYPILYRNLRFVWELIFRAYHADSYAGAHPDNPDVPGILAGEKSDWLADREEKRRLNWNSVMSPGLLRLFPTMQHAEIEDVFHPIWAHLSGSVHPSSDLRIRKIDYSELKDDMHLLDSFNEAWAIESLDLSSQVFDLIWLAVLSRFPNCLPLLSDPKSFRHCPMTRDLVARAFAS
jgi:hypothetical protein